ncbi:MAG: glutathione S-transferase family protein [Sphingobium sp.]
MPVSKDADIEITGFGWVPDFVKGQVRDLRVRWALEELGMSYRTRLLHAAEPRSEDYYREQPFGQVPTYRDGDVQLFESGSILLYLAEKDERLLPRDPAAKARAITWMFAALNSVEPALLNYGLIKLFYGNEEWGKLREAGAREFAELKLKRVSDWLGDSEWLEDRFTVADMLMSLVLGIVEPFGMIDDFPNLRAYIDRATARPAFKAAFKAQMADYTLPAPEGMPA